MVSWMTQNVMECPFSKHVVDKCLTYTVTLCEWLSQVRWVHCKALSDPAGARREGRSYQCNSHYCCVPYLE